MEIGVYVNLERIFTALSSHFIALLEMLNYSMDVVFALLPLQYMLSIKAFHYLMNAPDFILKTYL